MSSSTYPYYYFQSYTHTKNRATLIGLGNCYIIYEVNRVFPTYQQIAAVAAGGGPVAESIMYLYFSSWESLRSLYFHFISSSFEKKY
jgi:hypothetical protein